MNVNNVTIFKLKNILPRVGGATYGLDGVSGLIHFRKGVFAEGTTFPATIAIAFDGFTKPNAEKAAKIAKNATKRAERDAKLAETIAKAKARLEKAQARQAKLEARLSKSAGTVAVEVPAAQ